MSRLAVVNGSQCVGTPLPDLIRWAKVNAMVLESLERLGSS